MILPKAPDRYDRTDQDQFRNAVELEVGSLQRFVGGGSSVTTIAPPLVLGPDPAPAGGQILRVGGAVITSGKVNIGTLAPGATIASPETGVFALSVNWDILGGGVSDYGMPMQVYAKDTVASASWHLVAIQASAEAAVTGNYHAVRAIHALAGGHATGTVDDLYGIEALGGVISGTVTWAFGVHADTFVAGGSITNAVGLGAFCEPNHPGVGGTATTVYGLKIGPIDSGTTRWAIFTEEGNVRLGGASIELGPNANSVTVNILGGVPTGGAIASQFQFSAAGVARWIERIDGDESGSNTGSNWNLLARQDDGSIIDRPIIITRVAAGSIAFASGRPVSIGGNLVFITAASRLVPGATSFAVRNNANSLDNLLVADGGEITLRNQLKFTTGAATSLGTTDNFGISVKTNALIRWSVDTGSVANLIADTTNGGQVVFRAGASSVGAKATGVLFESNNAATTSTTTATITGGSNGGTYTLDANTLSANGDSVRITYLGYMSATTGTFTLTLGGSTIIAAVALSSAGTFAATVWVTRRDSTHIDWTHHGAHFNAATVVDLNRANNVAVDLTTDLTVNFQGSAAAGTFTAQLCQIVYEAA